MPLLRNVAALALSAALLTGSAAAASPAEVFPDRCTYPGFIDVEVGSWYADAARVCCQVGLMQGTGQAFSPDQMLTVGEVAAIAARMNEAITGEAIFLADSTYPWYTSYVRYLEDLGITVPDPEKQATRQEFVALLSAVVPDDMLSPINTVTTLPDTQDQDVLRFYNAGILSGVDSKGTFAPDKTLTRAECAAMVARVAREELRMRFTLSAEYTLYVGQEGDFVPFYTNSTLDPAEESALLIEHFLTEMSDLTGWNLDASEIFVGKGGVTISWADTSALFAGPPEPQKPGFHVYDSTQLAFSVLDSVQRTVQCAFSPENPDSLNLWFCAADGSALKLDNLGVTLPLEEPYSHTLLENLLSQ